MATGRLTKRSVDATHPAAKDQFVWDDELRGFGLKVTPAGNKVFLLQYRLGGRGSPTRRYTIGTYGSPWSPTAARHEAERLLQLVRQGRDPLAERDDRRRISSDLAFSTYADRFLEDYKKRNREASYDDAEGVLRLHLRPFFKSKALPAITRSEVASLFDTFPAERVALRRKVYAILSRMFRWAVGRGDLERSPLEGFEVPPAPTSRDRVLRDAELRLAWLAAERLGYPFGPLYRLLIGTGQRREEVSGLSWRELHRDSAEWHLPAARSKNGIASVIPLSAPVIAELDRIAEGDKWPRRGLVFTTTGETPVSGYSRGKSRLDKQMLKIAREEAEEAKEDPDQVEIEPWRVHDLRRTLATGMQRLGVRFEVTEAILNHVSGSKSGVAGVYQRHDWREEKRDALNAWAAHVQRIVSGTDKTNVIALAGRRA
ncbi:MAG: site-specific integrase [Sphingomicrobium sp.]